MPDRMQPPILDPLTDREIEILRRVGDGSSDREIAQALFLSLNTIKWHNRQIYRKLGVGSRTQAVALASQEGLLDVQSSHLDAEITKRNHNLPAQLTSFVGREAEKNEVKRLLKSARLLTLTGPGGVGKTRLAIQVAFELVDKEAFEHGIFFVDLAPISQPQLVGEAIMDALGIVAISTQLSSVTLEKYLRFKKLLLVFDNFEHLLEAAPLVSDLLSAAPDLRVLITSREALRLYGEQEYSVPPMSLPNLSDPPALQTSKDHEAMSLFIQRAQAVKSDLSLTEQDKLSVAEICIRLDGLPLAIELAAAQINFFSPQALLIQLESRFTGLKDGPRGLPERQRTLRGAIDWSYQLLDDNEKVLFARLSVFQGGRTIEAVEAVCCHDLDVDVLEGLASLLNKNLIRMMEGLEGDPRFTLLETIHEYGRELLAESGEAQDIHRRHAEFFTAMAEQAEPHTRGGPDQIRWLQRLETEHENLRTLYKWSMESGEVQFALRLVSSLGYFWWRQGHYEEGQKWTSQALELIEAAPSKVRAGVLDAAGRVAFYLEDYGKSKRLLGEALALYRELGSPREIGWTLVHLSMQSIGIRDEYAEAVAYCEEGLDLLHGAGDKSGITQALTNLGELARIQGDYSRATQAYEECLGIARQAGDKLREGILLINLGLTAQHEGEFALAQDLFQQCMTLAIEMGHLVLKVDTLAYLAGPAEALGQLERATRLLGAAETMHDMHGFSFQGGDKPEFERIWNSLRQQLDEASFDALWEEGKSMSLEEAIKYAQEGNPSDK